MRGKQFIKQPYHNSYRITPADAGKTNMFPYDEIIAQGSPPRMRGKRYSKRLREKKPGITPADAGKTLLSFFLSPFTQDHPRGCGENRSGGVELGKERGSPPRMRGKLLQDAMTKCQFRITPADAGKTTQSLSSGRSLRDHPRGCGENPACCSSIKFSKGSPPRMRGKRNRETCAEQHAGITPADAGKTFGLCFPFGLLRDHPRGCGENMLM